MLGPKSKPGGMRGPPRSKSGGGRFPEGGTRDPSLSIRATVSRGVFVSTRQGDDAFCSCVSGTTARGRGRSATPRVTIALTTRGCKQTDMCGKDKWKRNFTQGYPRYTLKSCLDYRAIEMAQQHEYLSYFGNLLTRATILPPRNTCCEAHGPSRLPHEYHTSILRSSLISGKSGRRMFRRLGCFFLHVSVNSRCTYAAKR